MDPHIGLTRMFTEVWGAFLDGLGIDAYDIEKLMERCTGLCEWRKATEADVAASHLDLEVGDPILCLTDEGKRIVKLGRA